VRLDEAVERDRSVGHDLKRSQLQRGTRSGEPLEHGERHLDLVNHATPGLELDPAGVTGEQSPVQARDHVGKLPIRAWHSAAATPSAASSGVGASFNRSCCFTMNPTCSLEALPEPTTAFLICRGAYSAIGI